jgi:hypothetical protein
MEQMGLPSAERGTQLGKVGLDSVSNLKPCQASGLFAAMLTWQNRTMSKDRARLDQAAIGILNFLYW